MGWPLKVYFRVNVFLFVFYSRDDVKSLPLLKLFFKLTSDVYAPKLAELLYLLLSKLLFLK